MVQLWYRKQFYYGSLKDKLPEANRPTEESGNVALGYTGLNLL